MKSWQGLRREPSGASQTGAHATCPQRTAGRRDQWAATQLVGVEVLAKHLASKLPKPVAGMGQKCWRRHCIFKDLAENTRNAVRTTLRTLEKL